MTRKSKTGRELEQRVTNAYRAMGARRVRHDVELAGNQIDVYVELEAPGRLLHRIAVEVKDWSKPVGIDIVNSFAQIVNLLHGERLIDEGVIVSTKGFSKQARNAAQTYGILLLEPAELDAMVAEVQAMAGQVRSLPFADEQSMVAPARPKRRRTVAIIIILAVVVSLVLTILVQPYSSPEPGGIPDGSFFWIVQVLVSFIAILASVVQLTGLDVRELFSSRPAGASVEAFPFHVIGDFDELLDYLFPDPTAPVLPDRSIRFLPRIADDLDAAFRQQECILVRGRSKTGKTREVVELLRRWWYTGPTVLLAKNHVGLYPPYTVPTTLPVRNLVLFFDDVDRYCGDADAVKRLDQTIDFFADRCHEPGELRAIATVRQEPEFWGKLHYDESDPPWNEFEMLSLPPLPPDVARRLIDHLAQDCDIAVDPAVAEDLAAKNDGTFLNLALSFRGWLHEGVKQVGAEQAAAFEGNLLATWRRRYERLVELLPEAGPIYAAVDLLQTLDVPLLPTVIAELATEMNLGRAYHLSDGLFHRILQKLTLSPWLDWYRDPRWRRRRGVVTLLIFYGFFYLLFCVAPASFQVDLFRAMADELWLRLLIISPLLIPLALSLILRWHHRWKQRRVQGALDRLLETEFPLRDNELRPYEGQSEGNGASRAWTPAFFAGRGGTAAFRRLAAPRLATVYWTWAEGLRAAGELGPARSFARLAGRLAPNHPMPPFVLGTLWYDQANFRRALVDFARSRALNPSASAALALERIAWCFYQLEEFEQVETAAGQALALMPTLPAARWARGMARLHQGRIEPGLADCRRAALARTVPMPDLAAALDTALVAARFQDWADQVSRLLERDRPARRRRTALWRRVKGLALGLMRALALGLLLGAPYVSRNSNENAMGTVRLVDVYLTLYPRAPYLLAVRCAGYLEFGDYEQAIADFTEAIRLDPDFVGAYKVRGDAHSYRGRAYGNVGDYEQAIADYTEVIRLDPDNAVAYHNRGYAYREMGEYEQAIADYTEAIRLDPDNAVAYSNRGVVYNQMGEYEQAIADFTEAIRLDPDSAWAYSDRGSIYNGMGEYEQAIADFTEAIRLDPDSTWAYSDRGYAYREMGEYEQAIADYTEAIRLDPDNAVAYSNRGWGYNGMGEYEQAIADYTEAIRLDPDYAWAYSERAYAYRAQGNLTATRADWERAVELYEAQGQTDNAAQVRGLLSELKD